MLDASKLAGSWRLRVLPAVTALGLALVVFPVSGQDDFFITLWPATTLAEGGELLNYGGERVEQSSTLLLTLLLALGTWATGLDPASFARGLSVLATLSCFWILERCFVGSTREGCTVAAWLLASAAPFVYWTSSGTEMTLAAALALAWAGGVHRMLGARRVEARTYWGVALATLGMITVRPEGALVCLACVAALGLVAVVQGERASSWRPRVFGLGLSCLGWTGLVMALRQAYFGAPWPLPVSAKIGGGEPAVARVVSGLRYLCADNGASWLGLPMIALFVACALRAFAGALRPDEAEPSPPGAGLVAGLVAGAYLGFAVTSGGDWMEGGRFLVPALPCLALCLGLGLGELRPRLQTILVGVLVVLGALSIVRLAHQPKARALPLWRSGQLAEAGTVTPPALAAALRERPWSERSNTTQLRDLPVLVFLDGLTARAEHAGLGPLTLSSHQMGFVAYRLSRAHPGALRFIDAAGLVERTLIDCPAIADRVTHNAGGLWRRGYAYDPGLKVRFLLEDVDACAPGSIDILYELGIPDEDLLRAHGLRLVYVQDGALLGRPVFTFVAVREELLGPLGFEDVEVVEVVEFSEARRGQVRVSSRRRP